MKGFSALYLIVVAFANVSCSKDQKVAREIEGIWFVSSYTKNNAPAIPSGSKLSFNFTRCKVKKGDCDGSLTFGSLTFPLTYRIADHGSSYTITCLVPGVIPAQKGKITERSKTKMVLISSEAGETYVTTLHR